MKSIMFCVHGRCDERLVNEALEDAGFDSMTEYRRIFGKDRKEAMIGAMNINDPRMRSPAVLVSLSAYKELTLEMIEKAKLVVEQQIRMSK